MLCAEVAEGVGDLDSNNKLIVGGPAHRCLPVGHGDRGRAAHKGGGSGEVRRYAGAVQIPPDLSHAVTAVAVGVVALRGVEAEIIGAHDRDLIVDHAHHGGEVAEVYVHVHVYGALVAEVVLDGERGGALPVGVEGGGEDREVARAPIHCPLIASDRALGVTMPARAAIKGHVLTTRRLSGVDAPIGDGVLVVNRERGGLGDGVNTTKGVAHASGDVKGLILGEVAERGPRDIGACAGGLKGAIAVEIPINREPITTRLITIARARVELEIRARLNRVGATCSDGRGYISGGVDRDITYTDLFILIAVVLNAERHRVATCARVSVGEVLKAIR